MAVKASETQPTFFATAVEFRDWLEAHHSETPELWIGFFKKGSGRPSITWPEAVDVALCFGWIDGIRKSHDESSYVIRFTPRRARSTWSAVNIKRVNELGAAGRMLEAGWNAFEKRSEARSGIYSFEQGDDVQFDNAFEQQFRANPGAWDFFQAQPAAYRKAATWWVVSAKKDETKQRRLTTLIDDSAAGRRIASMTRPTARSRNT